MRFSKLRLYIASLALGLAAVLGWTIAAGEDFTSNVPYWVLLVALYTAAELVLLLFHHQKGRVGLSTAEAVFLPMVVGLSFSQTVWGVTIGAAIVSVAHRRVGVEKGIFNVAQFGCAAATAAAFWHAFGESPQGLTPVTTATAVAAVLIFAFMTHIFVAAAIALAESRRFVALLRDVASAAVTNLGGNIILGLLLAASYEGSSWTAVLFPVPMVALFLGYRAFLRQEQERDRVEKLHEASRALASSATFEDAVVSFLSAAAKMVSASEAQVVLPMRGEMFHYATHEDDVIHSGPVERDSAVLLILAELKQTDRSLTVAGLEGGPNKHLAEQLGVRDLIATPLVDGSELIGCFLAFDRVGADEFSESDTRLLEALGNELVVTLDSYRLFAEVAEERERFQQIFAGSKEGICLLDEEGVIRAWNPALARITGFVEEDILGEKWSERVLVRDRNHQRIEGMDIVTVPPDEELELVTRQGPPRWVAIMSGEVQSEDMKSWVILVRDITREHELEESKSDFLSTISHELRTPLTTIKGSLQVMSRPSAAPQSEIGKQMVEIMKRGSDRLERLVMNLLAVSQMETGDVQVHPDEIELEELVRSRIGSILDEHPQVEVAADESVVVRADRERLSQAIEHILDNARKFGPESGLIKVAIVKENGFARVSITDEGPGIPKIDQERIFDRFVRLGHVLTRETQGPGVGLFIAKKSLEAMGGSVEVESEPDRGSTFHVKVPLARPMAAIEPASTA